MILTILLFEVMLSAGAAIKGQGLASTQNMYIDPLFPPRCLRLERASELCVKNSRVLPS